MEVDIEKNILITPTLNFHLDGYRWFLVKYYPLLCTKLFIKTIVVKSTIGTVNRSSYDWNSIFDIAHEGGYDIIFYETFKDNHTKMPKDFFDKSGNSYKAGDIIPNEMTKHIQR